MVSTRKSVAQAATNSSVPERKSDKYEVFYSTDEAEDKALRQLIDHKLISKEVMTLDKQAVAIDEQGFNVRGIKPYVGPIHSAVNKWKYDSSDSEDDEDPLDFEGHRAKNGRIMVSIKRRSQFNPDRLHGVGAIRQESATYNTQRGLDNAGRPLVPGGQTEESQADPESEETEDEAESEELDVNNTITLAETWRKLELDHMLVNPHYWKPKPRATPTWDGEAKEKRGPNWTDHDKKFDFSMPQEDVEADYKKFGLDITKKPSGESFPFKWEYELGLTPNGGTMSSKPATRKSSKKRSPDQAQEPDAENERPTKRSRKDTSQAGDDTAKKSEGSPTRKSTRTRRPTRKLGESTELPTKKRKADTSQDDNTDKPAPTSKSAPKKRGAGAAGLDQGRPAKKSRNDTPLDESDDNDDSAPTTGSSPKKRGKGAQSVHQGPPSGEGPQSQHAYIVRALAEPNAKMFQEAFYRLLDKDPHNVALDHEPYIRRMEGLYKGPTEDIRDSIELERGRTKKLSPPASVQDRAGDDEPGKGSGKKRPHSSESDEESSDEDNKPGPPKKVRFRLKGPRGPPPSNGASSSNASNSRQTQPATTSAATSQAPAATTQRTGRTAQGNRSAAGHGTAPYTYEEEIKLMELAKLDIDNATLLQQLNTWLRRPNSGCTYQRQGDSARQHASVLVNEGCTPKILRKKQMSWRKIKAEARKNGMNPGDDVSEDEEEDE